MSMKQRTVAAIGVLGVLALAGACAPAPAADAHESAPVEIAVFAFELQDSSPSAALLRKSTTDTAVMAKVTDAARRELAQSGRYSLIDVSHADAGPVRDGSLRNCEGCEAAIARQLGAAQSLIGVVTKVTQTDYYITICIRDARTGKIIDQQEANFAGSEEGWSSGVRMLIRHQVLPTQG
jgi:hypothetical protein